MPRPALAHCLIPLSLVICAGCASPGTIDPQTSADQLETLTGAAPRVNGAVTGELPAGVQIDDGLTADEAVALALWNNAAFQVSVSELGFANADLQEAGLLSNPVLSLLFPVGPKQFEAALKWPFEAIWQRPRRVAAAKLAGEVAASRLVQAGLDLVLAVRVAHTDLVFAHDRKQGIDDVLVALERIDVLTQSRLAAGDISRLDASAASIDAARGRQDSERAGHDVNLANARLQSLLGLSADAGQLRPVAASSLAPCGSVNDLLSDALAARPDIRAAELGIESAAAKLGWEQSRVLALTAVLDINGQGRDGFEAGPGLDIALPFFNRNQGGKARAEAELQRASAAYIAVQHQVALELREATTQLDQARQSQQAWQSTVVVPLEASLASAEGAFEAGDQSALFVLDHERRLLDARLRLRELDADLQRAHSRVERAAGRTCTPIQETIRGRT